jgi:hypothetical protein
MNDTKEGAWRRILGETGMGPHYDRSVIRLECGHSAVLHHQTPYDRVVIEPAGATTEATYVSWFLCFHCKAE